MPEIFWTPEKIHAMQTEHESFHKLYIARCENDFRVMAMPKPHYTCKLHKSVEVALVCSYALLQKYGEEI